MMLSSAHVRDVGLRRIPTVLQEAERKKPHQVTGGVFHITSLTITYFHTGCSTIIGAKSFHGPVRDGKGWDRLAMVIRHDLYEALSLSTASQNLEEVKFR